jgi:hypothetical protein
LKKGDQWGFKHLQVERIYGKRNKAGPAIAAQPKLSHFSRFFLLLVIVPWFRKNPGNGWKPGKPGECAG